MSRSSLIKTCSSRSKHCSRRSWMTSEQRSRLRQDTLRLIVIGLPDVPADALHGQKSIGQATVDVDPVLLLEIGVPGQRQVA